MATKFKKGDAVTTIGVIPAGPVEALRMDEDGNFFYQISWTDAKGVKHTRWFAEDDLAAA